MLPEKSNKGMRFTSNYNMLLTYSKPEFPSLIEKNVKIHTIRTDSGGRWKIGMFIHHWFRNPRNKKSGAYPFLQERGDKLISKQSIRIWSDSKTILIDDFYLTPEQIKQLAKNDGFANEEAFWAWFKEDFEGSLLHWTDFKYQKSTI